ncbi:hypothetical protein MNBD_GAMMA02-1334 [hydrothermal vent metagenome]|uniref:Uncharacterized protein n=1 Tax=hydrothermal vent metagenome TaxID=652676 RepID=A0A3B0VY38_9ZZZZ
MRKLRSWQQYYLTSRQTLGDCHVASLLAMTVAFLGLASIWQQTEEQRNSCDFTMVQTVLQVLKTATMPAFKNLML